MTYSYLALGDSYTIGELVPLHESFPYQTIQLLRKKLATSVQFIAPEIIAKTGWTTDELEQQLSKTTLLPKYDIVSLLIGVNNQYRGRELENYEQEFEQLLIKAIALAGGNSNSVFVLSIPDWGVTPFAKENDSKKIAQEIDVYNQSCENLTIKKGCHFINITDAQREDGAKDNFLASDGLHPSGNEYAKWAIQLKDAIINELSSRQENS